MCKCVTDFKCVTDISFCMKVCLSNLNKKYSITPFVVLKYYENNVLEIMKIPIHIGRTRLAAGQTLTNKKHLEIFFKFMKIILNE